MAMKYLFPSSMPYDDLTFIDQSAYTETTPLEEIATIPDGPIAFIPFVSPRGYGEDNKLMYMDSSRLAKYGNPNLKKYGLSLYLANRFIEGGGTLLGMRMMPKDAGYANRCICAKLGDKTIVPTADGSEGRYPNVKTFKKVLWTKVNTNGELSLETISYDNIRFNGTNDTGVIFSNGNSDIVPIDKIDSAVLEDKNIIINTDETKFCIVRENTTNVSYIEDENGTHVKDDNGEYREYVEDTDAGKQRYNKVESASSSGYSLYSIKLDTSNKVTESTKIASVNEETIPTIKYKVLFIRGNDNQYPKWSAGTKYNDFEIDGDLIPLFIIRAKAKGDFAKAFKFKITLDDTMNSQYPSRCFYKFSSDENGSKLDGDMTFTLDDDFIYGDDSLGINDVFEKYAANLVMFKASGFETFKTKLIEKFRAINAKLTDDDAEDLFYSSDILFGTDSGNLFTVEQDIDALTGLEKSNLSVYDLNKLNGDNLDGSIGTADFTTFGNSEGFTDPFADMFAEAYGADVQSSGIYTDLIYDEVRFPFEYVIVPSYDNSVMDAAYDLAKNRHITRVFFTYPKFDTYAEARQWATSNMSAYNEFISSEYCEWWQIKDPYTKKNTMMPSTYFNAYGLPYHWLHNKGVPYAGTRNYRWSGGKVGTMTPCSVNPNEYIANHNVGLNTMIEDGLGYASPYEQITSQQKRITSQLSELNNATILMNMARIALRMSSDARWTTLSDEEVNTFISNVQNAITLSLTGTYKTLRIEGERESVNGAGRNRIHCKFYVNFNDMLKGVTYEFYILAN